MPSSWCVRLPRVSSYEHITEPKSKRGGASALSAANLVRWGALGLLLGGLSWVLYGLTETVAPKPVVIVAHVAAPVLTLVGLVGLHALQRERSGTIGQVGFYAVLASNALFTVWAVSIWALGPAGLFWMYLLGFWVMVVGLVLYGPATVRAGAPPRWYGWLLVVALPASTGLSRLFFSLTVTPMTFFWFVTETFFWFGLFLLVLGYGLWSQRGATVQQPSRVR